jgi:hypothetical protein
MDALIMTVQSATLAREVLRDHRGTTIGRVKLQRLTGKLIARDAHGVVVGTYDPRSNETRDVHGRVIGRGNLLGALLRVESR